MIQAMQKAPLVLILTDKMKKLMLSCVHASHSMASPLAQELRGQGYAEAVVVHDWLLMVVDGGAPGSQPKVHERCLARAWPQFTITIRQ